MNQPFLCSRVVIKPDVLDAVKDALSNLGFPPIGTPATVVRLGRITVTLQFDGEDRHRSIHPSHIEFYQEGIIT